MNAMTEREKKTYNSKDGPSINFRVPIDKYNSKDINSNYLQMFDKSSKSEIVKNFQDTVDLVPRDLLKRAFCKMASSSEAYFVLRARFIQSHSYMCIAHYIVGVGDRHLNNTLIDKTTGNCIGIDFGHAFGTATKLLRIPEMIPFRLTPQMLNFILPIQNSAPYKQYMMAAMHALRKQNNLLLNTMDVFVHEPLLDWQKYARTSEKAFEIPQDKQERNTWFPKHVVNICKQKLNGVNPAYIMREELRIGVHMKRPVVKKLCAICEGDPQSNARARLLKASTDVEKQYLTVEDQIDCLVDLATDPNILGRAWVGWNPWM